jgi:V8-like Glu-specific endopeptidase
LNRIVALLIVVAAYGLLAAGASAKSVKSKEVTQSRAEVLSYWTAERMRDAKPVPVAKGGKPGGGGGGSTKPGTATQVPAPYSGDTLTNGKVFFSDGSFNYVCSGTALVSDNESVVWTAGHCVNEGPGGFYDNWMFAPGYHNGDSPTLGRFTAQELFTTNDWAEEGDFGDDLGAARVGPDGSGQSLNDRVAGRYLATTDSQSLAASRTYNSYGYPASGPFDGQTLWMCNSPFYRWDTSLTPNTMGIQCNMTGGSSGGGWVVPATGMVHSVNSYTYRSLKNVMFGPHQGLSAAELYTDAEAPAP